MTTRRPRRPAKAVKPTQEEEVSKIPQEELEQFFTDPTPEEVEAQSAPLRKRKSIPITGKVFLGEQELREWEAYRNFLYNQGVNQIRHKKI